MSCRIGKNRTSGNAGRHAKTGRLFRERLSRIAGPLKTGSPLAIRVRRHGGTAGDPIPSRIQMRRVFRSCNAGGWFFAERENDPTAERSAGRTIPTRKRPSRDACRYFCGGIDNAIGAHDVAVMMSIEPRTITMASRPVTAHSGERALTRAWRLAASFFRIAARSLPAAGV